MENATQKRCYLAFDHNTELTSTAETSNFETCELPDGNTTPSALKNPSHGRNAPAKFTWKKERADTRYDIGTRKILYACVVLTGGTTCPDGVPEPLGDWLAGGPVSGRRGLRHEGTSKPGQGTGR